MSFLSGSRQINKPILRSLEGSKGASVAIDAAPTEHIAPVNAKSFVVVLSNVLSPYGKDSNFLDLAHVSDFFAMG
jgi:hypothetical protein